MKINLVSVLGFIALIYFTKFENVFIGCIFVGMCYLFIIIFLQIFSHYYRKKAKSIID